MDFDIDPRLPEKDTRWVKEAVKKDKREEVVPEADYGRTLEEPPNASVFSKVFSGRPVGGRRCA